MFYKEKLRLFATRDASFIKNTAGCLVLLGALGQPAIAIERHPAPLTKPEPITSLPEGRALSGSEDRTPLGVDVNGIVIDDRMSELPVNDIAGVAINTENTTINHIALKSRLDAFIGLPLTFKLIEDIRAAIVTHMREQDRPLVAVIVPPQEITGGTLRVAVLPFVAGDKRVERLPSNHQRGSDQEVLNAIRVQRGEEIDSSELVEDLNWLNRSPFRKAGVVFKQGRFAGETDLTITLQDDKPWQLFAGYSNSGTKSTGYDRIYGGIAAELPWGALVSYQHATSPETIYSDGRFYNLRGDRAYNSHAISYVQTFRNRARLTLTGNYIHSRSKQVVPIVQDSKLIETSAELAMPATVLGASSEIFVGFDAKMQKAEQEFAGVGLGASNIELYQFNVGLRGAAHGKNHRLEYGLKGVFSPGGLSANNTNAALQAFSTNTMMKARYAYLQAWSEASINMPQDLRLDVSGSGQFASGVLPETERFDIGGAETVRGYATGETSGDHGFAIQAELHLPPLEVEQLKLDFFGFADHGQVYDITTQQWTGLTGIGLGIAMALNDYLTMNATWGHTLTSGPVTARHDNRLHIEMTARY